MQHLQHSGGHPLAYKVMSWGETFSESPGTAQDFLDELNKHSKVKQSPGCLATAGFVEAHTSAHVLVSGSGLPVGLVACMNSLTLDGAPAAAATVSSLLSLLSPGKGVENFLVARATDTAFNAGVGMVFAATSSDAAAGAYSSNGYLLADPSHVPKVWSLVSEQWTHSPPDTFYLPLPGRAEDGSYD